MDAIVSSSTSKKDYHAQVQVNHHNPVHTFYFLNFPHDVLPIAQFNMLSNLWRAHRLSNTGIIERRNRTRLFFFANVATGRPQRVRYMRENGVGTTA